MRTRPFLLRILLCFVVSFVPVTELDNRLYDLRLLVAKSSKAPSDIVLIDINGREFQELRDRLGQQISFGTSSHVKMEQLTDVRDLFYWDPQIYSRFLEVAQSHKPGAIAFTLYFPKGAIQEEKITESHGGATQNSIDWLGVLQLRARSTRVLWSSQFDAEGNFLRPAEELAAISNYGFNNLWPDRDGVVRKLPVIIGNHASLALASNYVAGQNEKALKHPEHHHLINFVGPAGSFKTCSFRDFIDGPHVVSERCGDISGKILVVGKDILKPSSGSLFRTPMGEMSRAEIIANAIYTLKYDRFIEQIDFLPHMIVRMMLILVAATFVLFYPILLAAILTVLFGLFMLGPVYQMLLIYAGIHIPDGNDLGVVLVTYLVFTGFKLAHQETLQWKALKQTQVLREVDRLKTNFLSLFSHDLKTPIAKIQGVIELMLRDGNLNQSQIDHLKVVLKSNNELKDYILSILNLSKIETNKVQLNKKSNDINQTINEACDRLKFIADQKGITIFKELEPMFSTEYDEELIRQVITNLVDNAIKYSPADTNIKIRSYEANNAVWVEVIDDGPGISPEDQEKVFRKFSRLGDQISPEKVKGTGLGLYLSKYFIELHGGKIQMRSPVDPIRKNGTVFTFSLPIA